MSLKKNILKTEKKTKNKKIVPFIEENEILGDFDRKYRSAFKEEIFNSKLRNKQRRLVRSSERWYLRRFTISAKKCLARENLSKVGISVDARRSTKSIQEKA